MMTSEEMLETARVCVSGEARELMIQRIAAELNRVRQEAIAEAAEECAEIAALERIAGMRSTHDAVLKERGRVEELEALLPKTFYSESPLPQRIERMVSGWNRAIKVNHDLEDANEKLETTLETTRKDAERLKDARGGTGESAIQRRPSNERCDGGFD